MTDSPAIAVVIPCYRVVDQVLGVIAAIPEIVQSIYCIDDACPDGSGEHIKQNCRDPRVVVIEHDTNQGVGGAVITGYRHAIKNGSDIVVKIDGDGQMDPGNLPALVDPITQGRCDYTKGNRFYRIDDVRTMPKTRLIGNAVLSFFSKLSTGYWDIFDPTNGYTAAHVSLLRELPLNKLSRRYFFETDMLFHLGTLRAVVGDIPMQAQYADEHSSLSVPRAAVRFFFGHIANFVRRVFYNYVLRDFNIASIETIFGVLFLVFGITFGTVNWLESTQTGQTASAGTVMLSALPIIVGFQLLLAALNYDIQSVPRRCIHPALTSRQNIKPALKLQKRRATA